MTYTQNRSKKLQKNKNMCPIFFFFNIQIVLFLSSNFLFRQCHCQKSNNFFFSFPPISAMPLSQTNCNNFFFLLFRQCHCHKFIPTIFPPLFRQCHCHKPIATKNFFCPPISAMPLPQIHSHKFFPLYFGPQINCNNFFPSYFGNAIATNLFPQFFFPSISVMPLSQIHYHKFSPLYFSNALPQINCHFFFFF